MFTGLIEEIGALKRSYKQGEAMMLTIEGAKVLSDAAIGDSIAVNGVCLTVTEVSGSAFTVDVMPQTYRHTNLKDLRPGERVNLERAMQAGGRFGGHIVQGHVDGTGAIISRTTDANAVVFTISPHDTSLMRYVIPQGSVTLDGISLTVVAADKNNFKVSIIPHTLRETALQHKQAGSVINIECDVLGKYVDHLLHFKGENHGNHEASGQDGKSSKAAGGLTAAFLAENGFF
ncbi:riboflavin synthase subunit alpha [Paenibacillus baekrokdamisoli]|uniref:Riboflavin synthase n=1 Tax=Paenibacillus baekrokdamisoli TaxID=1712516 RepID=A0A3G9IQA4_9BACL|nr:riboflavin synthase [Paenibacillus baekrokdamisoli]MBB3069596.1 riboflavin synthase [Paenibacillus baekrokdamisoli]BBH21050.1 riboflavin synthase subunit alpha [Paenibacillus baekrokdamisoli]